MKAQILVTQKTLLSILIATTLSTVGCKKSDNNDEVNQTDKPKPTQNNKPQTNKPQVNKPTPKPNKPTNKPISHLKSTLIKPAKTVGRFTRYQLMEKLKTTSPDAHKVAKVGKCGVIVKKVHYKTLGVKGEVTNATTALMIPKGRSSECQGKRPIFLYAHGTIVNKSYDFSEVGNKKNTASKMSTTVANSFASQGYIVVAPNYAGYDESKLNYHPYLNAKQQSHEMADALVATKEVLKKDKRTDFSQQLFIGGYSEGGHVALATTRYLENKGYPVTATVPMSGPYAMTAFGDEIFNGKVNLGATVFAPLVAINYNKDYGNIYKKPSDVIAEPYAKDIEKIIPGKMKTMDLFLSLKLPMVALFEYKPKDRPLLANNSPADPNYGYGFAPTNYLIKSSYRESYLRDALANPDGVAQNKAVPLPPANPKHPLRKALKINDLRLYLPKSPVMLCGGNQDPSVAFDVNAGVMAKIWRHYANKGEKLNVVVFDVDRTNQMSRNNHPTVEYIGQAKTMKSTLKPVFAKVQDDFEYHYLQKKSSSGELVGLSYHGSLTPPACFEATNAYLKQFQK